VNSIPRSAARRRVGAMRSRKLRVSSVLFGLECQIDRGGARCPNALKASWGQAAPPSSVQLGERFNRRANGKLHIWVLFPRKTATEIEFGGAGHCRSRPGRRFVSAIPTREVAGFNRFAAFRAVQPGTSAAAGADSITPARSAALELRLRNLPDFIPA